jgi:uncharacterized protein (DUF433 family)
MRTAFKDENHPAEVISIDERRRALEEDRRMARNQALRRPGVGDDARRIEPTPRVVSLSVDQSEARHAQSSHASLGVVSPAAILLRRISELASSLGDNGPSLGVEKTEGVCGGAACLVRTRIPVWSLIAYMRQGVADEALLLNFPTLRKRDLVSARLYAESHSEEIARDIQENETDAS